jgi:hypothetical protein
MTILSHYLPAGANKLKKSSSRDVSRDRSCMVGMDASCGSWLPASDSDTSRDTCEMGSGGDHEWVSE